MLVSDPRSEAFDASASGRPARGGNAVIAGVGAAPAAGHERRGTALAQLETTSVAAERALQAAGVDPSDVDLVMLAAARRAAPAPASATLLASRIRADRATGVDAGAHCCAGYLSALNAAAAAVESGRATTVLLAAFDPVTGAGAMVVAPGAAGGGAIRPLVVKSDAARDAGRSVRRVCRLTLEAAATAGVDLDQIDAFVFAHSAVDVPIAAAYSLELSRDRVIVRSVAPDSGSGADLPVAFREALDAGRLGPGMRIVLGGFGDRFHHAAMVVELGTG